MSKEKANSIDAVKDLINAKYKSKVMERASKAKSAKGVRLSTGIFALDMALGGGFLKGRVHVIKGEFSTGKSFVSTKTIASAQRHCRHCNTPFHRITQTVATTDGEGVLRTDYGFYDVVPVYRVTEAQYGAGLDEDDFLTAYTYDGCACGVNEPHNCIFVDAEGTYHPDWAEAQGVLNDTLNLIEPEFAEQAIDIIEALSRTGLIDVLVVDSVPALTPSAEIEKSAEDNLVGTQARLMNRFMRVIQSAINSLGLDTDMKPVILLINQMRMKVGVMFGNPETSPGGKGIDFTASTIVRMLSVQRLLYNTDTGKFVEKKTSNAITHVGVQANFNVPKNKTFKPFEEGNFRIDTDTLPDHGFTKGQVNNEEKVAEYAARNGVATLSGSWYSYKADDGTEVKGQGSPAFTANLLAAGLFEEVEAKTREAIRRI